ncbi:hypothetical protein SM2011_a6012 (plasmid) [Sinorhizobium meliloti 2011]|nr:hypothetical protein SM2011_a6012 [Sinorhizobium meliloti 2011]
MEIKYLCLEIRAGRTCKGGLDVNPEVKTGGEKIGYKPWPAPSQSGMKPSGS